MSIMMVPKAESVPAMTRVLPIVYLLSVSYDTMGKNTYGI